VWFQAAALNLDNADMNATLREILADRKPAVSKPLRASPVETVSVVIFTIYTVSVDIFTIYTVSIVIFTIYTVSIVIFTIYTVSVVIFTIYTVSVVIFTIYSKYSYIHYIQ